MLCGPQLLPTARVTDAFWDAAAFAGSLVGVGTAMAPPPQDRSAAATALLKPHGAHSLSFSLSLPAALTTTVTPTTQLSLTHKHTRLLALDPFAACLSACTLVLGRASRLSLGGKDTFMWLVVGCHMWLREEREGRGPGKPRPINTHSSFSFALSVSLSR